MIARIKMLSPRQKDCLRLTYRGFSGKEIARELNIRPGTVSSYCKEAIAILGARHRRHAAQLLHDFEATSDILPPSEIGPTFDGLDQPVTALPASATATRPMSGWGPFAIGNREADNELGVTGRLAWIIAIAVFIAIGFGALAAGIRTTSDLVTSGQTTDRSR